MKKPITADGLRLFRQLGLTGFKELCQKPVRVDFNKSSERKSMCVIIGANLDFHKIFLKP